MPRSDRRERARKKARFAPQGMVSDRRPEAVRLDVGRVKRLVRKGII